MSLRDGEKPQDKNSTNVPNSWRYCVVEHSQGWRVMLIAFPAPVREEQCNDGFRLKQISGGAGKKTSLNH